MRSPAPALPPVMPATARRPWLLLAVAVLAITFTLLFLNDLQPLSHWLFWRYARIYGLVLFFGLACVGAGHAVLSWPCRRDPLLVRERLLLDVAIGVLVFASGTFVIGIAHGLGAVYFWAFPSVGVAVGAAFLARDHGWLLHQWRRTRSRGYPALPVSSALAIGGGAIGILLMYLPLLTIKNISFDAKWYHLAIAEHYATAGRIAAFPEGWQLGTTPHLASWLYTWALTAPGLDLSTRMQLASHLEFLLFLLTLAGVPLLVERLLQRRPAPGTWAFFILFPGIFLYDSNLVTGADHVLAFWAIPLALSTFWFVDAFTTRRAMVLALACAGTALAKIQSTYLLLPAGLYVLGCAVLRVRNHRDRLAHVGFVLAVPLLGGFLLFTASHWLANLIWYHNPLYPLLSNVFPSRPWRPGMGGLSLDSVFLNTGTLWARVRATLAAPFTFAFINHDWVTFHRDLPVFGFLFTLGLPLLPFLPRTRKIWALSIGILLGVTVWYWTYHQDRYLQALLPWMVGVAAAILLSVWNTGLPGRVAVVGLIALQLVWGADVPFLPTRFAEGPSILEMAIKNLSSTYRDDRTSRSDTDTGYDRVAEALPTGSVVLLHLGQLRLGIGHPVVTDNPRWTSGPLLGSFDDPAAAWRQLRSYGVSHLLFLSDRCRPEDLDLESELVTHYLAERASDGSDTVDGKTIVTLAKEEPKANAFTTAVYSGCATRARFPWRAVHERYEADRKSDPHPADGLPAVDQDLFSGSDWAVVDERCPIEFPATIADDWKKVALWNQAQLWMRRKP